jgi:hypothetical protein
MKKINISFAITACNEAYELSRLLEQLDECMIDGDQITVQLDQCKLDDETLKVVSDYIPSKKVDGQKTFVSLDGNFADFKNSIKKHCNKDYIFFIDADEEVNIEQITLLREILSLNPTVDVFLIPRINTVEGLTQEHINKWRWNVNEDGWINWPDYQTRICRNIPEIKWVGAVHERLEGHSTMSPLPAEAIIALGHHKSITKQELQNKFYDTI